jgi:hypothetical protein
MRPLTSGAALAIAFIFSPGPEASAAEITTGSGIVVVELNPDESKKIFEAVDSAAAFSAMVAPVLPPEYQLAVKGAAGGWAALRMVVPSTVPLRVVLTAVPPAIMVLPQLGMTAVDVIRTYGEVRAHVASRAGAMCRHLAGAALQKFEQIQSEACGYVANCMLVTGIQERLPLDRMPRWATRLPRWGHTPPLPDHAIGRLEANREARGNWERFSVVAHSDGTVSFLGHTGFLCAECGGGSEVVCNRPAAKEWERWSIVKNGDGTIGLKSSGGQLLRADSGGSFQVRADHPDCNDCGTKFALEFDDGGVYLKTTAGKYVSAQP